MLSRRAGVSLKIYAGITVSAKDVERVAEGAGCLFPNGGGGGTTTRSNTEQPGSTRNHNSLKYNQRLQLPHIAFKLYYPLMGSIWAA